MIYCRLSFLVVFICLLGHPCYAASESLPLEITADSALEWNQEAKTYTASGNAKASQGISAVSADKLVAFYDDDKSGATNITRLEAHGHVALKSGKDTAFGENAIYDLVTGIAVISGGRVKIIKDEKNTLEADKITLYFESLSTSQSNVRKLQKAEAHGHVVITNGTQTAKGDKSTYIPENNIADISGHVKITQENNWLEGDRAEINLTTHVSRLTKEHGQGQVKGLFNTAKSKEAN